MTSTDGPGPVRTSFPKIPMRLSDKLRLRRIGVIDVGSNSVRLVVFDGMGRSPAYFYNEKVLCGLGAGLSETGCLNPEGRIKALAALHRFTALTRMMDLSGMIAVATAAVRDASDGAAFCDQVERETGLQIHIATGAEEARLSAKGVLLGWPTADGLVSDMGGSSMELAHLAMGRIEACATAPLGPLKLADIEADKLQKYVRKQIRTLRRQVPGDAGTLFLVGGSWRAIARLDMERTGYPLKVLHGYEPPAAQLLETLTWLNEQDPAELSIRTGTSLARMSLVPMAAPVLAELIARLEPGRIVVSSYGLREGLLYRQMPEAMRSLDPLIEICRHMENRSARVPGFGDSLYDWLLPLYRDADEATLRLARAACLLHDVNWRAHPDYRAEQCLASVTRANVGGIDHRDRVFLGLALLNRYKAAVADETLITYEKILPRQRELDAAVLGRVMRLGSMLSGSSSGVLADSRLEIEGDALVLILRDTARECAGEAVERRLAGLASRLSMRPELRLED